MEVILIEKVEKLGDVGAQVKVKNGYARNFLLPANKALRASKENIAYFEAQKKDILAKNEKIKAVAKKIFDKVENKNIVIIRQASDEGKLFGSVLPKDIAEQASETCQTALKKSQVILQDPIRTTGLFDVKLRIHADYLANLKVNVARSEEEAKENLNPKKKVVAEEEVIADAAEQPQAVEVEQQAAADTEESASEATSS